MDIPEVDRALGNYEAKRSSIIDNPGDKMAFLNSLLEIEVSV